MPEKKYLCEDKLNPEEEHEIFELTKNFLKKDLKEIQFQIKT